MKLIALDSSGLVASAAVYEDDLILAEYTVNYKKTHSQTLLPMLDELSKMIQLDPKSIDAIAVAAGPGSFTGLRIGSATAKGLGLALGKPLIEVPTLAALACNLPNADGLLCPIMDARRQQVYNGLYRFQEQQLVTVQDQRALSIQELCEELNARYEAQDPSDPDALPLPVIFLGDGVAVCRELIDSLLVVPHCYAPANANRQRAASVAVLGAEFYNKGLFVNAADHAPIYLRKSQAEREREQQLKTGDTPQDPFSRAAATPRVHLTGQEQK
ncbi:MAG: tRNA (adenosine(37)-N6)-threonylcarbamoyltransferase complex dimerization subunit type 1 TsaB [Lachnospiraceae bacterium]|nr:tRNA (adenosine(37)-N6)-threonylcarbamoyltransferase complex dimerization subunit type 1 TsaB [Lachnospiraceae bacterium]